MGKSRNLSIRIAKAEFPFSKWKKMFRNNLAILLLLTGGLICFIGACFMLLKLSTYFDSGTASKIDRVKTSFHCDIRHVGCFKAESDVSLFEEPVFQLHKVESLSKCKFQCFTAQFNLASYKNESCSCANKFNKLIFVASNSSTIRLQSERPCSAFIVYRAVSSCTSKPLSLSEAYQRHYGGCYRLPHDLADGAIVKKIALNPARCVLRCEASGSILTVTNGNACYCSNSSKILRWSPLPDSSCLGGYKELVESYDIAKTFWWPWLGTFHLGASSEAASVWRTYHQDYRCSNKEFLARKSALKQELYGVSGSGITWLRGLIEAATGYYTGSASPDKDLFDKGFLGEFPSDQQVLLNRTLYEPFRVYSNKSKVILLIRNPFDVLQSLFTKLSDNKKPIALANPHSLARDWENFATSAIGEWLESYYVIMTENRHTLVVYYEDLVEDRAAQLRRIVDFLEVERTPEELERRLLCAETLPVDFSHDQSCPLVAEPYDERATAVVNVAIGRLRQEAIRQYFPPLPRYEREVSVKGVGPDGEPS